VYIENIKVGTIKLKQSNVIGFVKYARKTRDKQVCAAVPEPDQLPISLLFAILMNKSIISISRLDINYFICTESDKFLLCMQ
jgi:hypothetical protein